MQHLQFLRNLKSVTFASSVNNIPSVRILDVMLVEGENLYFLTARGKPFYHQLKVNPVISIIGMDKKYKTVRVTGKIKPVGREWVDKMFDANPMMNDLYPGEKRNILDGFCMSEGFGEMFDLGVTPLVREKFNFGANSQKHIGYSINNNCTQCGVCVDICPLQSIITGNKYTINSSSCLECGLCFEHCPNNAVDKFLDF
ncbi:MAG: 4Fe-4S binding protein [Bacteroidales bacterium]|nr:4Fe-4S binding protein [Bacteroidales bacterium]